MTAAPDRPADATADLLRLEEHLRRWPLLTLDEARRELGLPVEVPTCPRNPNANSPQACGDVAFC